ncbi:MAG: 2-amino-4-hydroxy-6-hydroxymethyldihydropteridine diphosphokinase [Saprospiraceae bacterium]|nr:2-amino-4-hydroxy-6-hydroxymethyldihydropteridine diphosphokinase [Saprospiraceae bacterium]
MEVCILHLGSNLGDPQHNISLAEYLIAKRIGLIGAKSRLYTTEPWGEVDQNPFVNNALVVNTNLSAEEVLREISTIEKKMGRTRTEQWGPRIIDIDIIFYADQIIKNDDLIIPHPRLTNRNFVLFPLADICPDFVHPEMKKSIRAILTSSTDTLKVEVIHE